MRIMFVIVCLLISGCSSLNEQKNMPVMPSILGNAAKEILATDVGFNLATGEIKYTLPEAALVRVRIGIGNGGALLRTLIDWEYREAGPHTEIWDRKDAFGTIDFSHRPDVMAVLACIPADETVRTKYSGKVRGFRLSPKFEVMFPESKATTGEGLPIVSGVVPVRVVVDEKDKAWLTETKYEMVLFVDEAFLTEGEQGISPFNYMLDTRSFNNGPHVLTVNLASFSGEIGTKSFKIYVDNNQTGIK